jgi:hypothetical protein
MFNISLQSYVSIASWVKVGVKLKQKCKRKTPMKSMKYRVRLSDEERAMLLELLAGGIAPSRQLTRARILLKTDENGSAWTDNQIAGALDVSVNTVAKVRQQFVRGGLAGALERQNTTRAYPRCLDGANEAHLIALVCSPVPEGSAPWTLRLLAETMVDLGYVEHVSHETVRRVLKKRAQALA